MAPSGAIAEAVTLCEAEGCAVRSLEPDGSMVVLAASRSGQGGYSAGVSAATPGPWPPEEFLLPRAIRAGLLPEEAGDFDREFRAAMSAATETLDLTGVLDLLERWRRVARSSRDERAHRRMLEHADQLNDGDDVATEPWPTTRARLGL